VAGDDPEAVFTHQDVTRLLDIAISEDLGREGDVSSRIIPAAEPCTAHVVYRQGGVVCGLPLAERVLTRVCPEARLERRVAEGAQVEPRAVAAVITGPARGVLAAERTLLNFLQRLSGVATLTRRFVDAVQGTRARVLDTRKTTPGWRRLEKYAVRVGGGQNHRFGLYDQVLLKDNHLAALGGEAKVGDAVVAARSAAPPGTPLEVEVTTVEGALAAARAGADIVLLDNFTPPGLREAVQAVRRDAERRGAAPPLLEASGGITLETVRAVAETGVDRISTGTVTHSARALDIALDFAA
jgi:nicotinate-nucleotide pyrophosphorylase (carboxylating)